MTRKKFFGLDNKYMLLIKIITNIIELLYSIVYRLYNLCKYYILKDIRELNPCIYDLQSK
jgi:hypothetical protein